MEYLQPRLRLLEFHKDRNSLLADPLARWTGIEADLVAALPRRAAASLRPCVNRERVLP